MLFVLRAETIARSHFGIETIFTQPYRTTRIQRSHRSIEYSEANRKGGGNSGGGSTPYTPIGKREPTTALYCFRRFESFPPMEEARIETRQDKCHSITVVEKRRPRKLPARMRSLVSHLKPLERTLYM